MLGVILALSLLLALLGARVRVSPPAPHDLPRPPRARRPADHGIGQIEYRCHDGQIVTQPLASRSTPRASGTGGCGRCSCCRRRGPCSSRSATTPRMRPGTGPSRCSRSSCSPGSPASSRPARPGSCMDDQDYDAVLVAVWAFIGGCLYGVAAYWALGGLLHGSLRALGSRGSYRRARHLLAFAAVPVALSLALWLVKLALFGGDLFRSGGSDAGAGGDVFDAIELGFFAWTVALLVIGVRAVQGWTWGRSAAAVAGALVAPGRARRVAA